MAGACERVAAIVADADVKKTAIKAVQDNNPFAFLNKVVDKLGGSNESQQMNVSVTNTNMKSLVESLISNNCKNIASVDQTNQIVQNTDCLLSMGTICGRDVACLKEMKEAVLIKGVKQSNKAQAVNSCEINATIQALAQQESTVENVAKLQALQDAQGIGASNKTQQSGCSEVNTNITDEKYLKTISECTNEIKAKQLNLLNTCGASGVDQANDVDLMNKCLIGAGIIAKTAQGSAVKNTTSMESDQKAVGISPMASLASLGSCCFCCCIIIIIAVVVPMFMGGGNPAATLNKFKSFKK
jgi:hypothetical protein